MEVVRIRPDQWETLREVRLRALADAPHAFLTTHAEAAAYDDDEWRRRATARASGDREATFLALDGEHGLGMVGAQHLDLDVPTVELVAMWTAPEARRSGVGQALLDAARGWAVATGARRLVLWVRRENAAAAAFYSAIGFVDTDEPVALAGDPCADERRMLLDLSR